MASLERGEPKIRIRPMEHEDIDSVLAIDQKITGERRAITYTELITGDLGEFLPSVLSLRLMVWCRPFSWRVGFILWHHRARWA